MATMVARFMNIPRFKSNACNNHMVSHGSHRKASPTRVMSHSASVDSYTYEDVIAQAPNPEDVEWIFGYGSIIFKQGFELGATVPGYMKGWKRVFHQGSTDHRGTREAPGRTVTLIPKENDSVWGIAFKLPEDLKERRVVLEEMEWREKQYDRKVFADLYSKDGTVAVHNVLTYVATSDSTRNRKWAGHAPLDDIAAQIAEARGPSGPNSEYLFLLADGLRKMGVVDDHVFDLESRVKAMQGQASSAHI